LGDIPPKYAWNKPCRLMLPIFSVLNRPPSLSDRRNRTFSVLAYSRVLPTDRRAVHGDLNLVANMRGHHGADPTNLSDDANK